VTSKYQQQEHTGSYYAATVNNMKHFRIPGSQWIGNQIIALGMLYYRKKDLL
jgi:hypothetical protein